MTEPVAYLAKSRKSGAVNATVNEWNYHDFENIPLYTKEQLYPIAEMTQEEFDEFEMARNEYENPSFFIYYLASLDSERKKFKKLFSWIYKNEHGKDLDCELLFHKLWVDYELEKRGGAVKIVPDMKWFVRSKKRDDEGDYLFLSGSNLDDLEYFGFDYARAFDTKEGAEQWKNPLTEAVQLPVEGE